MPANKRSEFAFRERRMKISCKNKMRLGERFLSFGGGLQQRWYTLESFDATHVEDCFRTASYSVVTNRFLKAEAVGNDYDRRSRQTQLVLNLPSVSITGADQELCPAQGYSLQHAT